MNKLQAFQYIVLKMASLYIQEELKTSSLERQAIDKFNSNNNFTRNKCLLLPFFICTANGDREILFNYFQFKATSFGIIESDIDENIIEQQIQLVSNNSSLITFEGNMGNLKIKSNLTSLSEETIIQTLGIDSTNNYFQKTKHSIGVLNDRKIGFESFDEDVLMSYSKDHRACGFFKNSGNIIPAEFLYTEKSMFSEKKEFRIYN